MADAIILLLSIIAMGYLIYWYLLHRDPTAARKTKGLLRMEDEDPGANRDSGDAASPRHGSARQRRN